MIPEPRSTVCLTIAGLDPSGGAGVVADVKTFSAFGCFAAVAVTSVTFQNTTGVFGAEHQSGETVRRQIEAVFDDLDIAAVKTGMLPTADVIRATATILKQRRARNIVVDPVVRSTSGFDLIDDEALKVLCTELFRVADVVTPNLPEAERISGLRIVNVDSIVEAAARIRGLGARNVLIKGGHRENDTKAVDHLFVGEEMHVLEGERLETTSTHGTGCTLSSAIAANLAMGRNLVDAVGIAKRFVTEAIRHAPNIGRGHSPINQLVR